MIDESRLSRLEAEIGAPALRQVLDCFLVEAAVAIAELGRLTGGDGDRVARTRLHLLRGCASTVGATRLAALCAALEPAGAPDRGGMRRLVREYAAARRRLAGPREAGAAPSLRPAR